MIRAGVDLGSARVGVFAIDGDTLPAPILACEIVNVGRRVPRDVPLVYTRQSDGVTVTQTDRHEVTRDDEHKAASDVIAIILATGAELVTLESIAKVYFSKTDSEAAKKAKADAALATERIGMAIDVRCRTLGIRVETVTMHRSRGRVAGSITATAAEIETSVRRHLPAFADVETEGRERNHVRDAACAAIYGMLPARAVRPKRSGSAASGERRASRPRKRIGSESRAQYRARVKRETNAARAIAAGREPGKRPGRGGGRAPLCTRCDVRHARVTPCEAVDLAAREAAIRAARVRLGAPYVPTMAERAK